MVTNIWVDYIYPTRKETCRKIKHCYKEATTEEYSIATEARLCVGVVQSHHLFIVLILLKLVTAVILNYTCGQLLFFISAVMLLRKRNLLNSGLLLLTFERDHLLMLQLRIPLRLVLRLELLELLELLLLLLERLWIRSLVLTKGETLVLLVVFHETIIIILQFTDLIYHSMIQILL